MFFGSRWVPAGPGREGHHHFVLSSRFGGPFEGSAGVFLGPAEDAAFPPGCEESSARLCTLVSNRETLLEPLPYSIVASQCLDGRRIGDLDELRTQIGAWSLDVNTRQPGAEWRMKINGARCRLKSVYPKIRV